MLKARVDALLKFLLCLAVFSARVGQGQFRIGAERHPPRPPVEAVDKDPRLAPAGRDAHAQAGAAVLPLLVSLGFRLEGFHGCVGQSHGATPLPEFPYG